MGIRAEIPKQNPSKASILPHLLDLRLYKEGIEYDPKEEWRYLSDTEFCDIVGECLTLKPVFFMDSLYTDLRLMMKREFGENRTRLLEKRILEKFCFLEDEQILYELKGNIKQTERIEQKPSGKYKMDTLPINISVNSADIFITNYRMIGNGKLKVSGGENLIWFTLFTGGSKKAERKEALIESSPVFGYQFPIKNHTSLGKIKLLHTVAYFVNIKKLRCTISIKPTDKSKRDEQMNAIFDILRKDASEVLEVIHEVYETEILEKNKRRYSLGILKDLRISEEFKRLSDSDYFDIVKETYKLDPVFFMNSIYPKMKSWKFPEFLRVKEDLFENLKEGLNNDQIIGGFQRVIDMGVDNKVKSKSFLKRIEGILQDNELKLLSDSEKVEIIFAVYKLDTELFMRSIYPKIKRWKFPAFLRVKDDLFERLPISGEQKYNLSNI